MNWYYAKNGHQNGPLPTEDMIDRIAMGEIAPTDLAWCEGMGDWLPVAQIPQLKVEVPPTQAPGPIVPPAAGSASSPVASPYQAPMAPAAAPSYQAMPGQPISSYLWQSIVVTLLCCLPAGIVAIVYAAKVDGLKNQGDLQAAKAASDKAKKWCIISLVGAIVVAILYGGFMAFVATRPEFQEQFRQEQQRQREAIERSR